MGTRDRPGFSEQQSAVESYIAGDALPLNQALRDGRDLSPQLEKMEDGLDAYLESGGRFSQERALYRVVHSEQQAQLEKMKVGDRYEDKGYTSTTKSLSALNKVIIPEVEDLGPLHVMKINVKKETLIPGKSISSRHFQDQEEFLFQRGTAFKKVSEETRPDGIKVSVFDIE